MKKFIWMLALWTVTGCALQQNKLVWRVKDMVLEQSAVVHLQDAKERVVLSVSTRTIQEIMLAHIRISRTAKMQSEIYLAAGDDPNAFAGPDIDGRQIMGITLGMVKLIGDDRNEYAALIGHEAAHLAKGHGDSSRLRSNTLNLIGTVVGSGLGLGGVPAGGLITGLGVDLIDSAYNRDQEREADAVAVEYMVANQYDPKAAIRLHEKMLKHGSGFRLPFLSSHPSSQERIENLKAVIEAKSGDKKSPSSSQAANEPVSKDQ